MVAADVEVLFSSRPVPPPPADGPGLRNSRPARNPHRGAWAGHTLDPIAAHGRAAEALGVVALDFCDAQGGCGARPGARLSISAFADEPQAWMLACEAPALLPEIGDWVNQRWSLRADRVLTAPR